MQRGRKRFFVLHQDSYNGSARIDCYESEKRFRYGATPKLSVPLKQCFNINKKVSLSADGKFKYCIAVYTYSDCLLLGCETEQEQEAWLQTLLGVLVNTQSTGSADDFRRPCFEHVWDVKILKNKGITEKTPKLAGFFRFCLNSCSVYFYKVNTQDEFYEFPLVYISNYGHQGNMFFLRVGRSALTGSGELWMNTEDVLDAVNIHETMKQILEENHELRQRNMPVEPRRAYAPNSMRSNSVSVSGQSGEMFNVGDSRLRAISESEKTLQKYDSFSLQACSSYPCFNSLRGHFNYLQSRSVPGVPAHDNNSQSIGCFSVGGSVAYSRSASHSPSIRRNIALTGFNMHNSAVGSRSGHSTDSVGSTSTYSEADRVSVRSGYRHNPLDLVGVELSNRSAMSADGSSDRFPGLTCSPVFLEKACMEGKELFPAGSQESMSSNVITHFAEVHSPADCLGSFRRMTLDSGCVDAASPREGTSVMPTSYSSEQISDYTPMAPSPSEKLSKGRAQGSWNMDEIRPYPHEFDGSTPPSRAYSCGSKPSSTSSFKQPSWLRKLHLPFSDERKRAHSFGNWNKFVLRKNSSSYLGSDSSDSCLRARSDSCGSDEYASTSRNGTRCQPRTRLFDSKFSSCSEDLVEIDFRTASSSFGQSQSGSLGSTDSLGRSRANSMGTNNMIFKQTWLPKVEQITEQELTPSVRLVQDLFDHERNIPSDTVADYVPMSPCVSIQIAESVAPDSPFSNQEPSRSSDYLEMTCDPSTSTDFRMSSANDQQCNKIGKLEFNFPGTKTDSASDEASLHCLKTVSSRKKTGTSRRHTTSDPCSSSVEETQMKRMKRNPNTAVQYPLSECSSSIQLLKKLGRRSWHGDCVDEVDQTVVRDDCVFNEATMLMNAGNTKAASCRTEGDYVFVCPPPPSC
ncbi:insulin receptor substrate 1 [Trichuris trichiura]|uniref:Insulin receptor substrate 1 n=1 Tax=Trichuris trichiura TaxID=36087 RepID=A0A077Z2M1_TRITR|nr:insulin receptor substrate 1 [Trichuris trichiura]